MSEHAFLSPSAATRWLSCKASPFLEANVNDEDQVDLSEDAVRLILAGDPSIDPDVSSKVFKWAQSPSTQGTVAHELFERVMLGQPAGEYSSLGVPFTDEMRQHVNASVSAIRRKFPTDNWHVETRLPIWKALGLKTDHIWGTADLVGSYDGKLVVADFKYGKHKVSPKLNHQLRLYAVGAMGKVRWRLPKASLNIVQPRTAGPVISAVTIGRNPLQTYADTMSDSVKDVINNGLKAKPVVGNHCWFCKAKPVCQSYKLNQFYKNFPEMKGAIKTVLND